MRACNVARPWLKRAPCALEVPGSTHVVHCPTRRTAGKREPVAACFCLRTGPSPQQMQETVFAVSFVHTKGPSHIARSSCCHAFACASDVLWLNEGLGVHCAFPGLSFQACACMRDSRHVCCVCSADPRVPARLALAGRSGAMPPADSFPSCPMASRAAWLGGCQRLADEYAAAKLRRRLSGSLDSRRCAREKSWS